MKKDICLLNKDFWNELGELNTPIREVLQTISADIKDEIKDKFSELKIKIITTVFTGSLTGLNYDEQSDIDLHFIIDFSKYENKDELELTKQLLSYYAKSFNDSKFKLLDHTIEIYFQDETEEHLSPGIYDITKNEWIQEPDCIKVNYTKEQKEKANEYKELVDKLYEEKDSTDDDKLLTKVKNLFKSIRDSRKKGLSSKKGMYSDENIVFKMLRRNGTLEELTQLMLALRRSKYSLKESLFFEELFTT